MLGGAKIGRVGDIGAQHQAARGGRRCLHIFVIGADIADMGKSERDDLTGVGRIGENFLIAGDGGVEANFAERVADGADACTPKQGSVG